MNKVDDLLRKLVDLKCKMDLKRKVVDDAMSKHEGNRKKKEMKEEEALFPGLHIATLLDIASTEPAKVPKPPMYWNFPDLAATEFECESIQKRFTSPEQRFITPPTRKLKK